MYYTFLKIFLKRVASIVVMQRIANPCYSGSIPLPPFAFCERDGMVDMSDLGSGDVCRVGSSPTARKFLNKSGAYTCYFFDKNSHI